MARQRQRDAMIERPLLFRCGGDELVGVIAQPAASPAPVGMLIVVGGPQYRAGSHRQFIHLARSLAARGVACMRFDYRGMGDGTGSARSFAAVNADIGAAVEAFLHAVPQLASVALWGLCDGASAACFYAPMDARVSGLILLNPWVRTESGEAQTMLEHHYLKRLIDRRFWRKFVTGEVALARSARDVARAAAAAARHRFAGARNDAELDLPSRMCAGVVASGVPFAIGLSGRDYVAREFERAMASSDWAAALGGPQCIEVARWESADHTFSRAEWRAAVEDRSFAWLSAFRTRQDARG